MKIISPCSAGLAALILFTLWNPLQLAFIPVPPARAASLDELWERFSAARRPESNPGIPAGELAFPGRHVGGSPELAAFVQRSGWQYRQVTYELYFDSGAELARSIYSLALLQLDVGPEVTLERFERGVQGFHYSLAQVVEWAEFTVKDRSKARTDAELRLLDWLLADGVVALQGGKVVDTGKVRHIVGAAPGKKRAFALNLRHERLHVYWDENAEFAARARVAWAGLDARGREEAFARLKGYARDNEAQIIEEWAVFAAEDLPDEERRALVGI